MDDPLQAAAVHGFCGIWGMMVVGLFASQSHLSSAYGITDPQVYGTFLGGGWEQLGVQMLAVVCIAAWSAVISAVFAIPLKMFGIFRVPAEVEENGLDSSQHGGSVYEATMLGKPVVRKRFHHHRSKDDSADMMPGVEGVHCRGYFHEGDEVWAAGCVHSLKFCLRSDTCFLSFISPTFFGRLNYVSPHIQVNTIFKPHPTPIPLDLVFQLTQMIVLLFPLACLHL